MGLDEDSKSVWNGTVLLILAQFSSSPVLQTGEDQCSFKILVDFFHSYISELGADPFRHPPNSSAPSLLSEAKPFASSPSINIFIVAQGTENAISDDCDFYLDSPLLIISVLS